MLQIPRIDGTSPISNILKNFNTFNNIPPKIGTNFTWMKGRKVDRKKYYQKIPFLFNLQWSTTFLSCFRNCVFTNNLKETNNPSLSCDIRCMISILKVDGDHTATAASLHTNTMTLYWKVSLGEWREEIISTLHLRSCIMGSKDRAEDGQRWQVMERSQSQGQWSEHWGKHIVCNAIVTSIKSLLQCY